jgi:uncharacterized protein YjiS (DUF1127 family)
MSTASALASLAAGALPSRRERTAITLWVPPHRRLAAALAAVAQSVRERMADAAVQRAQARRARREQAALSALDARTLRDIGLGDWAVAARDADSAGLQREIELSRF